VLLKNESLPAFNSVRFQAPSLFPVLCTAFVLYSVAAWLVS